MSAQRGSHLAFVCLSACIGGLYLLGVAGGSKECAIAALGSFLWLSIGWGLSTARREIQVNLLLKFLLAHVLLAFLLLHVPPITWAAKKGADHLSGLLEASFSGSAFVFGPLGERPESSALGFIFAFQVLPGIVFVATMFELLRYARVLQFLVDIVAREFSKVTGTTPEEIAGTISCVLFGMVEGPIAVRHYLLDMDQGRLFAIMTAGMASASAATLEAYVLTGHVPMSELLTAVLLSAPASLLFANLLCPQRVEHSTRTTPLRPDRDHSSAMAALAHGAQQGLSLALSVAALLIASLAILSVLDRALQVVHLSLASVLGFCFYPVAVLLGIPNDNAHAVGGLMGMRLALNELIAFSELGKLTWLPSRTRFVTTVALCGFANLSSMGVMTGSLSVLATNQKETIGRLVTRALFAGILANLFSASVVSAFLH